MATSAVSNVNADDPWEMLIQSTISIEREPQSRLKTEKAEQQRLKAVMSDVDSRISALNKVLERFTSALSNPFSLRSASTPADAAFKASATDKAAYGTHTLMVERLARADARVSAQRTAADTSLKDIFDANGGSQTFTIDVASPSESDPNARVGVEVTVTPTGTTDKEVMAEIAAAVNEAMDQAVSDGLIKSNQKASASVVNETSGTTRLSLRSGQTGYGNRLSFTDSPAGLLSELELTNNALATGTGGGQLIAVGSSESDSELNSKFVLDGLTLYRDTNEVKDALDGVTLTLSKVSAQAEEFSVSPNSDKIKSEVEDFIAKYNATLQYVAQKSAIDPEAKTRGDFANDSSFTSLRFGMRNDVLREVSGQPEGAPSELADLGIAINNDGTLSLKDSGKLIAAVKADAGAVQNFFSGSDGLSTRLSARVKQYVAPNGIIDQREKVLDERIKRLDSNIKGWDTTLSRREDMLRQQYAAMQKTIAMLQGQQSYLFGYM